MTTSASSIKTWAPLAGGVVEWAANQLSAFLGSAGRVVGSYRRSDGPHAVVYSLAGSCYAVPVSDAAATSAALRSRDIPRASEAAVEAAAGRLPPEWSAWRGESQDLADLELAALLQSEGHPPLRNCADAFSHADTLTPEALAMRDRVEARLFPTPTGVPSRRE